MSINEIQQEINRLKNMVQELDLNDKVSALNMVHEALDEASPFQEPIGYVKWVKQEEVEANEYNPNKVATPEMELLYTSIKSDGYTQPIVCYQKEEGNYEIVDGFHRNRVGKEHEDIKEQLHGYLPITIIDKPLDERMGSTIRHNRARGSHQIRSMSEIVVSLSEEGWTDQEISEKLGMEMDEIIRHKQISGLKEAFSDHEFSRSWEEFEEENHEQLQ